MELPKPPPDHELRTIIDKLAQFVARNGPDFEQMTKNKQKGNPRFSFLFGGEYFNYYQYKVTTEQAILKQKEVREPPMSMTPAANLQQPPPQINANNLGNMIMSAIQSGGQSAPNMNVSDPVQAQVNLVAQWFAQSQPQQQQPPPPGTGASGPPSGLPPMHGPPPSHGLPPSTPSIEALSQQQANLQEQITQSEQNLNAQHMVLMQQQDAQIEQEIRKKEMERICMDAEELGINLSDFDSILHPIIESCTKDSISNGKAWILQRANSKDVNNLMAQYLLSKVLEPDKKFIHKLHIIYLVNDILHHCVRKHTEDFKVALEDVVVPMFCNASLGVNEEQQVKLSKLLVIWEAKNHYFPSDIVRQLKDPTNSWERYKQKRLADFSEVVERIVSNTKNAVSNFQSQHMAFVTHAHRQIQIIEQQKIQIMEAQQKACAAAVAAVTSAPPPPTSTATLQEPPSPIVSQPPPQQPPPQTRPRELDQPPPALELPININQPPPGFGFPPVIELPDLTRPPPGFAPVQPEVILEDLLPSLPYYDLPAGLMVPLIKLEDFNYKSLDPEAIRLPPPAPPSERLIAAVKAFYMPPRHEQPRDCDGWEKLGLYEYFRAKASARKQKEMEIEQGVRERSRSPTPVRSFQDSAKSPPPKRRYCSRSRSRSPRDRDRDRDKDRDRGSTESRSGGGSDRGGSGSGGSSSKSRRSSRRDRSNERRESRADREDSNSREGMNRSPTPPSFLGVGSYSTAAEDRLSEANKGHQMLKKMGWSGAGLGAKEQGIEQPIPGGDVRDKTDQYKGVGINLNDPYENFRKSKGQAFITRMKARAEERAS